MTVAPRLIIPHPSLVVLCGIAGSGKSTFARRHFRPETTIVSSDRSRALVGDDEANMAVSPLAFELFHHLIDLRLRWGRLTVADSTALRADARRDLRRLARRHRVPAVLIVFDVSEERAYTQDTRRARRVGRGVIREQWERLQAALRTVREEGFDRVYVLGEDEVNSADVEVVALPAQRAGGEPARGAHPGGRGRPSGQRARRRRRPRERPPRRDGTDAAGPGPRGSASPDRSER